MYLQVEKGRNMTELSAHFMDQEIAAIRRDTPGAMQRLHLDNAGASLPSTRVMDAVKGHIDLEMKVGGYVAQEQQICRMQDYYHSLAALLGGRADDYAFASSAVDGWTKAFYSMAFSPGDVVVTAYNEYCSNYVAYLHAKKTRGIDIRVAEPAQDGSFSLDNLETLLDEKVKLISLSHVPSSSGQVNPVAGVGALARKYGIPYLLDACQAVGHLPVNVDEIGCDMMTGTGRKFLRGPRGTGLLYVSPAMRQKLEPVVVTNQAAAWTGVDDYELLQSTQMFEAWERSVALQIGFAEAVTMLMELGQDKVFAQLRENAAYLRKGLSAVNGVTVCCPADATAAIITFNKDGMDARTVKEKLDAQGVGVQVASVDHTRIDLERRGIQTSVRISPHIYTVQDEMDRFLTMLDDL